MRGPGESESKNPSSRMPTCTGFRAFRQRTCSVVRFVRFQDFCPDFGSPCQCPFCRSRFRYRTSPRVGCEASQSTRLVTRSQVVLLRFSCDLKKCMQQNLREETEPADQSGHSLPPPSPCQQGNICSIFWLSEALNFPGSSAAGPRDSRQQTTTAIHPM